MKLFQNMTMVWAFNRCHIKCSSCADLTTDLLHKGICEYDSNNALLLHPQKGGYLSDSKPFNSSGKKQKNVFSVALLWQN